MNPRIGEIVDELDRVVTVENAGVIAFVDPFWQQHPPVAKQQHYTAMSALIHRSRAMRHIKLHPRTWRSR